MIEFGPFRYDPDARLLYRGDEEISLPMRVVAVLESFLKRPGQIVQKNDILASAWEGAFVGEDSLTQAVSQLRSALGDDPRAPTYIQTIPKRGYRFIAEVSEPLQSTSPVPRPSGDGDDAAPAAVPAASPEHPEGIKKPAIFARGETVSHYELIDRIGAGAMGQVWRARDRDLQRDVAIKVVPDELAGEKAVIERFRREALMLAAVNHPNIATIHGVEEINGTRFIVMELLQGETLQARLERGALPIDEALEIAVQITRALSVAHDAGIVHRDLKPSNVMLGPDGQVKVLDFGLAKDARRADGAVSTDSTALTATGLPVGTAAYMSPEQAAGKPVDKRSDIFSFGCALFEMLAGTRPFGGTTASEIVAGILKDEPEWEELPKTLPRPLLRLLRRCLEKDPDQRIHDVADARIEIDECLHVAPVARDAAAQPARLSRVAPWGASAALALALAATLWNASGPDQPSTPVRIPVDLPDGWDLLTPLGTNQLAISPDGKSFLYRARSDQQEAAWFLQSLDELIPTKIEGLGDFRLPFFSPDGRELGFWRSGRLYRASLSGGEPVRLVDTQGVGYWWGSNGSIVFHEAMGSSIRKISENGGEPETLVSPDRADGELGYYYPQALPGGNDVLFTVLVSGSFERSKIAIFSPNGGTKHIVHEGGYFARYVPTGHLVYVSGRSLMAVPFDLDTREVSGTPTVLYEDVRASLLEGNADFHFSDNGTLVFRSGGPPARTLERVNDQGRRTTLAVEPRRFAGLTLSSDGSRAAVQLAEDDIDIWLVDLDGGIGPQRLTDDPSWEGFPVFSPNDEWVTFASERTGIFDLWQRRTDLSEDARLLWSNEYPKWPSSWSPDGRFLAYWQQHPDTDNDIWIYDTATPEVPPEAFQVTEFDESRPRFSPKGNWIAYQSNRDGPMEIYVAPYPIAGRAPKKVSAPGGGILPRWSPDGDRLYYHADVRVHVVTVTFDPVLDVGLPEPLFSKDGYIAGGWELLPDGDHLLINRKPEQWVQLNLILNWFEELKRLVPTGRE